MRVGYQKMGHTTFVLAKNILTWTECIEDTRSIVTPILPLSEYARGRGGRSRIGAVKDSRVRISKL